MSVLSYFKEFARPAWIKKFFAAKTAPLSAPAYFRDFPELTGNECTHCLECRMICPAPGAIDVVMREDGKWEPQIIRGHCFRCGYCVEICPEEVMTAGDILARKHEQRLAFTHEYEVQVHRKLCMGCGNCTTACPVNREIDPEMGAGGTSVSDDLLMRVVKGRNTVLHNELCKGCKVCEDTCPNGAMHVARRVQAVQKEETADA
ncbi:4Fe-4S binding protein [Methanorbis furvi]|uniref:NAD(P)H-quinone oxidoreductase subunit I, chloroplastic n=1 Tax=Methanorbis furvi TaxID=3028299 RepID=A0AAE4SBQ3_9EURY|nr:NAD(P)H-quinone oxidoreductase subunit I, chloroplastic [Methanocorpusculaceae archaeon Ag1]